MKKTIFIIILITLLSACVSAGSYVPRTYVIIGPDGRATAVTVYGP